MSNSRLGTKIFGQGFNPNQFAGGAASILGGLFGDSGAPYDKAMDQYKEALNQGKSIQNPFYSAGVGALAPYQDWLKGMQDPSSFINKLMGGYQESPWAKYMKDQAMRAGTNAASASGLTGSTPFAQQIQQNAGNISSADMNNWLQQVLGINTQYGQGQQNLISGAQNAANSITNMLNDFGKSMGEAAYGREAGGQQDFFNTLGGIGSLAAMFF